jgi:uncharacterized RDD family membrane protein YckC/Tfp pilus assembly major pilin PilA
MSTLAAKSVVPLYAGFWRRGAASILDSIVLIVPNTVLTVRLGEDLALLVILPVYVLYFALMHASAWQATVGKRAFGIKVTDLHGNRIGIGRAVGRVFGLWLSWILLGIGVLIAAFTARRQALHDMICGTLVVNRAAAPQEVTAGGDVMPVTAGVWVMIVVIFIIPFFGGILAAIAIPAYNDYLIRARMAEVINAGIPLRRQVEQAHAEKRAWSAGAVAIDSKFARGAEITPQGHVVVTLADELAPGGRLRFTPVDGSGALQWKCSGENVPPKYLPLNCRQ